MGDRFTLRPADTRVRSQRDNYYRDTQPTLPLPDPDGLESHFGPREASWQEQEKGRRAHFGVSQLVTSQLQAGSQNTWRKAARPQDARSETFATWSAAGEDAGESARWRGRRAHSPQWGHRPRAARRGRQPMLRTVGVVLVILVALVAAAIPVVKGYINHAPGSTALAAPTLAAPPDGFGMYEECTVVPSNVSTCIAHLQRMAAGGFKLVLNYNSTGTPSAMQQYGSAAASLGMKVIWNFDVAWSRSVVATMVNAVKDNPGTWGYYVGDELAARPAAAAALAAQADYIHQLDPSHPRLEVQGLPGRVTTDPSIKQFAGHAEVLGEDYYPIGDTNLLPYTQTGAMAANIQSLANQAGAQSAFVLQALAWSNYTDMARCQPYPSCAPFPTEAQIQSMVTQTLTNAHPRLVLFYSYFDVMRSSNPAGNWANLVAAVNAATTSAGRTAAPPQTASGSPAANPAAPAQTPDTITSTMPCTVTVKGVKQSGTCTWTFTPSDGATP